MTKVLVVIQNFDVALVNEDAVSSFAGGFAQDAVLDKRLDGAGCSREVGAQGSSNALDV